MLENYKDVLTVKDLSNVLRICDKSTRKLLHEGKIQYITIGRRIRIPKWSVEKFLSTAA